MADATSETPVETDGAPWDLIPWYVNGTLSDEETALVERYRTEDPAFAAEIERETGVAAKVCMLEDLEEAKARSWETLRARIEAEEAARTPLSDKRSWWANLLPSGRQGFALAGLACAAMIAVFVVTGQNSGTDGEEFRTLTGDPVEGGPVIKFRAAADLDRAALEQMLSARGLTLIDGPSETGVYRAGASAETDLESAADALMQAPEILFAAPE